MMDTLNKKLNIDETFTKPPKKDKVFNKIKDNVPLIEHFNYMADLLSLPKTKEGFIYLLVVVDLANDEFDIEPMKNKDSKTTLNALKEIFNRDFVKKPKFSITTDGGTEFKGIFNTFLNTNDINHKTTAPHRHKQLANVESLNRQLGKLFNGYMNAKEKQTKKVYREWTDILDIVREDLNKLRVKELPDDIFDYYKDNPPKFNINNYPTFKVGDFVYNKLEYPKDALGRDQPTSTFRVGDFRFSTIPKKITKVLIFPKKPTYRYLLDGIKTPSYTDNELMKSKDDVLDSKFAIAKIIGKKKIKGKINYLIWWKGLKKKDATYVPKSILIEDGLENLINLFEESV